MTLALVIFKLVIMIVVPCAITALTYVGRKYIIKVINKIDDEKTKEALEKGVNIISDAVDCVQQTYVDDLKKAEKFTVEEHKKALALAKSKAITLMNTEIKEAIEKTYGDLETYVTTIIESVVKLNK